MSFGFRIFSDALRGSEQVDALNANLDALELQIQANYAEVNATFNALKSLALSYGLKLVVFNYNSPKLNWADAAISLQPDGRLKISAYNSNLGLQLPNLGVAAIDPAMSPQSYTAAKTEFDKNKGTAFSTSASAYEQKITTRENVILAIKKAQEDRRIPIFDSGSIAWNQVDMFLVPAGLQVNRSYAGIGFSVFRATQMFVNSHPKDGVGAAGKAIAPLVEVYGDSVSVSGGNRDTYVMVVAQ
jgi:hypothetical protein